MLRECWLGALRAAVAGFVVAPLHHHEIDQLEGQGVLRAAAAHQQLERSFRALVLVAAALHQLHPLQQPPRPVPADLILPPFVSHRTTQSAPAPAAVFRHCSAYPRSEAKPSKKCSASKNTSSPCDFKSRMES